MNEEEMKFDHVLKTASSVKGDNLSSIVLKSYLYEYCRRFSDYKLKLPVNIFGPHTRCSHCHTAWSDIKDFSKFHVIKKKMTKSAIKRHKEISKNKDGKYSQDKVNKSNKLLNSNILLVRCAICARNTEVICKQNTTIDPETSLNVSKTTSDSKIARSTPINNKTQPYTPAKKLFTKLKAEKNKFSSSFYQHFDKVPENKTTPALANPNKSEKRKRQKDKFAGLCKMACASAIKKSETPEKKNPLNIFLKRV